MSARSPRNEDLHGNAPDCSCAALLLVDVINSLEFPGNEDLVLNAEQLGRNIAELKRCCRRAGIPAIYINDNRGRWRSDFEGVVRHCLRPESPGRKMVEQLLPDDDDYLVLKPKHSIFFATPLGTLLEYIGVDSVIIAGVSTNSCVLLSVSDAFVRDYKVYVPRDCVAGLTEEDHRKSLELMEKNFAVNMTPAPQLDLTGLARVSAPSAKAA